MQLTHKIKMKNKKFLTIKAFASIAISSVFFITSANAKVFEEFYDAPKFKTCFVPGEDCCSEIVNLIEKAKRKILIQAYVLTDPNICDALIIAKNNGVHVEVIIDRRQAHIKNSLVSKLIHNKVPVWVDSKVSIAHNKVIIIDGYITITGSFNFTKSANKRNSENVIIIKDERLSERYEQNWEKRKKVSDLILIV